MPRKYDKELALAIKAAKAVSDIQRKAFGSKLRVIRKSSKELVSNVDMQCQAEIIKVLSSEFDYPVFSEEESNLNVEHNGLFWVVDPLDGTHNFIAGLPMYGCSICLASDEEFHVGVIALPESNKIYSAHKGEGAFCNGERIEVSTNDDLEKGMISYDNQFYLHASSHRRFKKLAEQAFTTRITGSAVYDFCLIAEGVLDARIWNNTKAFDFAAGIAILTEAGGAATEFNSSKAKLSSKQLIASNGLVHNQILECLDGQFVDSSSLDTKKEYND